VGCDAGDRGGGRERVILKVYGGGEAAGYFTRDAEVANAKAIGKLGLGPQVLYTFDEGRVEEFVDGRPLTHDEMCEPSTSRALARALARFHRVGAMSHNDVHCNNVMLTPDGKLVLIDFEYAGPVDAAYDIANHFCEWMYPYAGPEPHMFREELYPSLDAQRNFVRAYLSEMDGEAEGEGSGAGGERVDELLSMVSGRARDVHAFWVRWAKLTGPSEFNDAYGRARAERFLRD